MNTQPSPGKEVPAETPAPAWMYIEGRQLMAGGQPLQLRGIGLGNWMLVEHFMIGLPQVDYVMRSAFQDVLGPQRANAFWRAYMDNYLVEADLAQIKALGFNHVRLALSYRHLESDDRPGVWREEGFQFIDRLIGWCRRHGLWVLIDLHSAPGCQASDWNAESAHGEAYLWDDSGQQARVVALWGEIARRYRDEPTVMAYEILNEPVTGFAHQVASLNAFHHRCIAAIRAVDSRHIIVVNGDKHATDLRALDDATFADPQVMAAFHYYYQFTAPFRDITDFPCVHDGQTIDADYLIRKTDIANRSDRGRIARPEFLDEFGSWCGGPTANAQRKMVGAVIQWCESKNIHWCLWHWKDVRAMGIVRMKENAPWLQLLEKIGARQLHKDCEAAIGAYMKQVETFLPLEGKRRHRLRAETDRDLQMQTLWTLAERMKDLSADELAALGRSFNSENFELDAAMANILAGIMAAAAQPHVPTL